MPEMTQQEQINHCLAELERIQKLVNQWHATQARIKNPLPTPLYIKELAQQTADKFLDSIWDTDSEWLRKKRVDLAERIQKALIEACDNAPLSTQLVCTNENCK